MRKMAYLACAAAAALLAAAQPAMACDVNLPECRRLNELLERMDYRQKLLDGQRKCLDAAEQKSPESLEKKGVLRALGVVRKPGDWPEANEAYQRFVSVACGGEEVVQVVLQFYRAEWQQRLSPSEVTELVDHSTLPSIELQRQVNAAAGARAALMLDAMARTAGQEYEEALKPFATMLQGKK
ncbi:MAG: hypothetical protein E6R08_00840 [Nevskiaceae bacterium]|nr:MAG: hypothetical protein E6R08_00840 [Nevskiaceae bacterium]